MPHHHYLLNKPHSYLSQFTHKHPTRRNKKMLGELYPFAPGTMAIGRLDENSEGLLLLTTDGQISAAISSGMVEKEYYAQLRGVPTEEVLQRVSNGVEISISGKPYRTKACTVNRLDTIPVFTFPPKRVHTPNHGPTSWVSVTLREGKYRQVRKMLAVVGHPVVRLVRVRIGKIRLGEMAAGEVREVGELEY
ncbi:MAG: pseudouridine synthase [Bacteroidota bacterium]